MKNATSLLACGAILLPQVALAEDSIYVGDCARARIIQQQTTIDQIMVFDRYEGVQRIHDNHHVRKECKVDVVLFDSLTLRYRDKSEALYDVTTGVLNYGTVPNCIPPEVTNSNRQGAVRFTTKLTETAGVCDLHIWSEWAEYPRTDPSNPNWQATFNVRVNKLDHKGLVIAQPNSGIGEYHTPIALTGVK